MRFVAIAIGIGLVVLGAIEFVFSVYFMFEQGDDLGLGRAGHVIVGALYGSLGVLMAVGGAYLVARSRSST
jgi:uncharacterized iron-regulated membrane protein